MPSTVTRESVEVGAARDEEDTFIDISAEDPGEAPRNHLPPAQTEPRRPGALGGGRPTALTGPEEGSRGRLGREEEGRKALATTDAVETSEAAVVLAGKGCERPHGWSYSAEALRGALLCIRTENKSIDEVELMVREVCGWHGVKLAIATSESERGFGGRKKMVGLKCVHGMRNRQAAHREKFAGTDKASRKSKSQRTGCSFQLVIRWPVQSPKHKHPYVTAMHLDHNHPVRNTPVEVKVRRPKPKATQGIAPQPTGMSSPRVSTQPAAVVAPGLEIAGDGAGCLSGGGAAAQGSTRRTNGTNVLQSGGGGGHQSVGATQNSIVRARTVLYAEMLGEVSAIVGEAVQTLPLETVRNLVTQFVDNVRQAARIQAGAGLLAVQPELSSRQDRGRRCVFESTSNGGGGSSSPDNNAVEACATVCGVKRKHL